MKIFQNRIREGEKKKWKKSRENHEWAARAPHLGSYDTKDDSESLI